MLNSYFAREEMKYLKNSFWYLLGSGVQGSVPILVTPIITRSLSPEQFGEYVLVISAGTVLSFLFALGISASLFREVVQGKTPINNILRSLSPYRLSLTFMAILSFLLELIFTEHFNLFFVSLSLGFSLSLILIQLTIFKATFQARKFAFTAVASTVIPLLILTIISYSYNNNFLINIYVLFVLILATTIGFKSMFQFSRDWQLLFGKLLKIGSPTLPHDIGMSMLQYVDRIIIAALFGLTIAGQIHVAALIGAIPYLLLSTLSNIWAPAVLEKYKINYAVGTNFLNKTTKIAALGSGFIALLITFNSDLLLRLFSPLAANDPSLNSVVILMSLSGIIYSAYLRNMHLLTLAGKFQSLLWITPTAIAAQILLIYLLSPIYGLFIVAAANLFAISLQAILTQNVIKGLYPNFSLTKMPLYSILVCSVIVIFYLLY